MNHAPRLRDIADLCDSRGLPVSARQLREIADELEPKPLLSDEPTQAEIALVYRAVGERRKQTIADFEALWASVTKLQLTKGKNYHDVSFDNHAEPELSVGEVSSGA